jgi:hypothetical protein
MISTTGREVPATPTPSIHMASDEGKATNSVNGCDTRPIQVSVGMPQTETPTPKTLTIVEHVLSVPFLVCMAGIVLLFKWRRDFHRLLLAVIHRIEKGDGISMAGVSIEKSDFEPFPIYQVIEEKDWNKNGLDME